MIQMLTLEIHLSARSDDDGILTGGAVDTVTHHLFKLSRSNSELFPPLFDI